ncbi:MAG: hypothetical protein ACOYNQ_07405 [Burkholderiales bacterium]
MEKARWWKVFVGHKRPTFQLFEGFQYASESAPPAFRLKQERLLSSISDGVLSEYYSLFMLNRNLKHFCSPEDLITICQHRRFVLNRLLGEPTKNQPWARFVTLAQVDEIKCEWLAPRFGELLIGSRFDMGRSVFNQYVRHHPARDLLRFSANLVDVGIFSDTQAVEWLEQTSFIPSPSCGTFPVGLLIPILEALELASLSFFHNGYVKREGYQGRSISFLIERLNSALLDKALADAKMEADLHAGYTTLVSETSSIVGG